MQIVKAADLLNNAENINMIEFESSSEINLDFKDVNYISLNGINTLMNLKKIAVLNNKKLSVSNANSKIIQMLDITGLNQNSACYNAILSKKKE